MTTTDVLQLLEANQNARGIKNWEKVGARTGGLRSFGIGLTQLRKLAKQVGRNRELAAELWESDVYDAKVIALLIDDPKAITREQAEAQVEQLGEGMLSHVFSSCDATLAKTPFVRELADDWIKSKDPVRRCCGYGLLYEITKSKKKDAPDDVYFIGHIDHIRDFFDREKPAVRGAMGGALMGIGKRNKALNAPALKLAKKLGPIRFDDDDNCEPFDVVKHLESDYVKEKFGL